tara:strand:+ start:2074 stop:2604 length:531 start_codon:yes stop_codon:yes gene_type:complete
MVSIVTKLYPILSSLLPPLNEKNLPWIDVIHPIVVHFVIAMALGAVVFDLIGIVFKKPNLFEVSFLNLIVATIAIFIAIVFGQIEAGLSNPYGVSRDILNYHSTIGWSLAGVLSVITGWRYVSRQTNPQILSKGFIFIDIFLAALVCTQVYLGDMLVWIYGLHTVPVVQAVREGLL